MQCVECHSETKPGTVTYDFTAGDIRFSAATNGHTCPTCGESYTDAREMATMELCAAMWLLDNGHTDPAVIRFARKAMGLRAVDLAEILGVTDATVSRWENGLFRPEAVTFAVLASLVLDKMRGSMETQNRLAALKQPAKAVPHEPVHLDVSGAAE